MNDKANVVVPIFDPENPDAFKHLDYADSKKLNNEQQELYQLQKLLETKHLARLHRKKVKQVRPDPDSSSKKIFELGHALSSRGFRVEYWNRQGYGPNCKCHHTWAQYAAIFIGDEEVGSFYAWRPSGGFRYRVKGWEIETNRFNDPNVRWRKGVKRLQKLESAIKHIKATAIPTLDVEGKLAKATDEYDGMYKAYRGLERSAFLTLSGKESDDLRFCVEAVLGGATHSALNRLKIVAEKYSDLATQANALKLEAEAYKRDVVVPLKWQAYDARPEVYDKPYEDRPE